MTADKDEAIQVEIDGDVVTCTHKGVVMIIDTANTRVTTMGALAKALGGLPEVDRALLIKVLTMGGLMMLVEACEDDPAPDAVQGLFGGEKPRGSA